MSQIINNQQKVGINTKPFEKFLIDVFAAVPEISDRSATVAFISDERMIELNSFFRGKNKTTDVLSFPHESEEFGDSFSENSEDFLGDIIISAEQAERQAAENGLTFENEVQQLILHGLLHLVGYDHETDDGEMNTIELTLRKKLGI